MGILEREISSMSRGDDSCRRTALPEHSHVDPAEQGAQSNEEHRQLDRRKNIGEEENVSRRCPYRQRVREPTRVRKENRVHGKRVVQESCAAAE